MTPTLALWLLACAGDDPTDPATTGDTADTTPTPTGTCAATDSDAGPDGPDFAPRHGELVVRDFGTEGQLTGSLLDGPPVELHREAERQGSCRLLRYEPSTCDPGCEAGTELCVDGACVALPRTVDAGDLVLGGVVDPPRTVSPDATGAYWVTFPTGGTGDATLEVSGGADVAATSTGSCRVGAPDPIGDWEALFAARAPGEDVTLTWSSPNPEARVRMRMTTGTGTHGGIAHAELECEGPDEGRLELPGAWLDELYAEGWSCGECGVNELFRYRAGRIGDSGARLVQEASVWFTHRP